VRADLPNGTVTFLFTDIEGSTALLHELGAERYAEELAEHRRLLRAAFARHGGCEVDTQGDAFFYAFPTAPDALEAATEGQRALSGGAVRVRMGLHTGTPALTDEGYVGLDVHRAARIASTGHGGQVVVSSSTAALVDPASLTDLGEHRLKDLRAPERLFQLGAEEHPPLKSLYRSNLPVVSTPFLGRHEELADVVGLLSRGDVRLVTLTGPGGTGKTRLALHAAGECSDQYPDGVYWVPLAALTDPQLVLDAAAKALGVQGELAAHLATRRLLLLLDNFEQVIAAAGGIGELLALCPGLAVMVTSREPLHLSGEQEYAVPPLVRSDSVELFLARARSVVPGFEAHPAVADICRRLDDLPLAVELAAARVKVLSPEQLLARLDASLPLLTGGARDLPERQRTLEATIAWSYDLLDQEEQQAFRGLGVFTGGCTLELALDVAGADLDVLTSLVDKSQLRRTGERFWMLETVREYAVRQLEAQGEIDVVRRRHAERFLALAESANLAVERTELGEDRTLVTPEIDNLRAAVDWAFAAGDVELATSVAVALEQHWVVSSPHEGARRFEQLLTRSDDLSPQLRARAHRARGGCEYIAGDFEAGNRSHAASLALFRELGDVAAVAHLVFRQAVEAYRVGDPPRARELCEESLRLHRSAFGEAQAWLLLGEIAFQDGRPQEALELVGRSAAAAESIQFHWWQAQALQAHAEYALRLDRLDDARAPALGALRLAQSIGNRQGLVYGVAALAWLATRSGQREQAGRLWGGLESEVERAPVGQWEHEREFYAGRVVTEAVEFELGVKQGRELSLEALVQEALDAGS
jgi:predicted ATPase/class 3 adenylate cyclase